MPWWHVSALALRPDSFGRLTRRLLYSNPFAYWHLPPIPSFYLKIEPEGSQKKEEGRKSRGGKKRKEKGEKRRPFRGRARPIDFNFFGSVWCWPREERSIACELISFIEEEEDTNQWILMNGIKKKRKKIKFQRQPSQRKGLNFKAQTFPTVNGGKFKKGPRKIANNSNEFNE